MGFVGVIVAMFGTWVLIKIDFHPTAVLLAQALSYIAGIWSERNIHG